MGIKLRASPRFRYYYNGAPAAGYTLYAYEPGGGLVPKAFYTDYTGGTSKTSVVLDANGEADIWWDGVYNVIIKNTSGVTVLDTDYYGEGEAVEFTDGFNYSYNGSFEIDTDGDGTPDDWTVSTYTGGTQTLDSDSYHGGVALKFTSTGNGGGIATNTKHPINEASDLVGKFTLKASAASMRLVVDLVWYSVAGAELSTTNLYDDTATNPSTYTITLFKETPPANARFAAFRIYGGHSSSATTGSCWFDDFVLYPRNILDADLEINSLDVGDYGTESAGTNINGTVYTSGFRYSDISDTHLAGVLLHRHSTIQPTVLIGSRSNSTGSSHGDVTNGMALFTLYGAGWTGSHYDLSGSISFGASSSGTISATSSPGKLEFSVTPDGSNIPGIALTIDQDKSATFAAGISAGAISGTTGTFSGAISGTTGTFSGAVSGTTGTFSGAVSGTTGTFSGAVSASSYGAINATTGTFSGNISSPGLDLTGITDGYLLHLGTGAVDASNIYQDSNGNIGIPWELFYYAPNGNSFSVTSQETTPLGIAFKPDGTSMYVIGQTNDTVYQYTLSTAWDVSTASYASKSFSVASQDGSPVGLAFSSDGTSMYVTGTTNEKVYQYTLSTAWDVSTASYASKSLTVTTQDTIPTGLAFNLDGTSLFICGNGFNYVYQYTLSTAWDVSTASYASKSFDVNSQDGSPYGIAFNLNGTSMFILGVANDVVYQYALSTAWDVSTASYSGKLLDALLGDSSPYGLAFSTDGLYLYVLNASSDIVIQYQAALLDVRDKSSERPPISTTSGTSHDYTSIPSWVNKITITFSGVSTNGTSVPIIQIGDSGGIETSGYSGAASNISTSVNTTANSTGFNIVSAVDSASVFHGICELVLLDPSTNTWAFSSSIGFSNVSFTASGGGSKALSATLDRIRLTTVGGTDAFDAGNFKIMYG